MGCIRSDQRSLRSEIPQIREILRSESSLHQRSLSLGRSLKPERSLSSERSPSSQSSRRLERSPTVQRDHSAQRVLFFSTIKILKETLCHGKYRWLKINAVEDRLKIPHRESNIKGNGNTVATAPCHLIATTSNLNCPAARELKVAPALHSPLQLDALGRCATRTTGE